MSAQTYIAAEDGQEEMGEDGGQTYSLGETGREIEAYKFDRENIVRTGNMSMGELESAFKRTGALNSAREVVPLRQLSRENQLETLRIFSTRRVVCGRGPAADVFDNLTDMTETDEEVLAYGDPPRLTILNWGVYGPGGVSACAGHAANATAPPNLLHAHNPGGPNEPGTAANPTTLPGGVAGLTWRQALDGIWRVNVLAHRPPLPAGAVAPPIPAIGNPGDPIEFVNGDPTILSLNFSLRRAREVCFAIQSLLGPHSRVELVSIAGPITVL